MGAGGLWMRPLTPLLPVSTECSSRPEPRAWQHSPQRWDARRPHPAGFLSGTCWTPSGSYAPFTPGQARAVGREGEREREVSSSSVCHGLNTVALCWFKPFPSHPFLHPFRKSQRGEKRWRADTSCMDWSLLSSHPLHFIAAPGQGSCF